MANSVDPDQTAPLGAVWSGSALFAQAYLSENLGSLRYPLYKFIHDSLHCSDYTLNVPLDVEFVFMDLVIKYKWAAS